MRYLLSILFLIASFFVEAQSNQEKYLQAKSYFGKGDYENSILQFASLSNDPVFGAYSTFYLGLGYCKNNQSDKGLDAWRQLLAKYPKFEQIQEVHIWMSTEFIKKGEFDRGIEQAQSIEDLSIKQGLYRGLSSASFDDLCSSLKDYPEDEALANAVAQRSLRISLSGIQEVYVDSLRGQWNIESVTSSSMDIVKKKQYSVAVMLPFLFDDLSNTDRIVRNTLVMEMYQGILLAQNELSESGMDVVVSAMDTKKELANTKNLLEKEGMEKVDLIIGPLFPEPIGAINKFAEEHEINVLNPISSNRRVLGENPFAFQLKPSYETIARRAAQYVAETSSKPESMIYFENKGSEKILAETFKETIESFGMRVTQFQPLDSKSARAVLARFSDQEENVLRLTDEEVAELREKGRAIRDRKKYDASGNLITKEDGTAALEYYEMNFTVDTDSLDHIFAVTRSNLLANNFIGAVESITDTVRLIGLGDWLDFSMLDYRQLERLAVNLIDTEYYDREGELFLKFREACIREFRTEPTIYHMLGFESLWWAGNMMKQHGKYFQNGFNSTNDFPSLLYGHDHKNWTKDNQIVPIIQFKDRELKALNLSNESNEE